MWIPSRLLSLTSFNRILFICIGITVSLHAHAGSLGVNPVRLDISHHQPTAVLTLENQGDQMRSYQIETFSWTQENNEDRYSETRELIAVPPLFTLQPKQRQLVRVGVRRPSEDKEVAFRIFIQELPIENDHQPVPTGIRTLLRIGIPVFLAPLKPLQKPELKWSAERSVEGVTALIVENPSGLHIQIGRLKLGSKDSLSMAMYVLPGQRRRWTLPEPIPVAGKTINIQVETDQGRMAHDATILEK